MMAPELRLSYLFRSFSLCNLPSQKGNLWAVRNDSNPRYSVGGVGEEVELSMFLVLSKISDGGCMRNGTYESDWQISGRHQQM